ncbi:MAG: porin [Candidatus Omnitrophica bacterium]|nr:porin [Candidatus Omnitrophota bacterium]
MSLVSGLWSLVSLPVWADEPSNASLKSEIEVLKDRLAKLERQLTASELRGTSGIGEKAGVPGLLELPSGLQGLAMSGYVDTAYNFNFNRPDTGSTASSRNVTSNNGRVFDRVANNFTIHAAELVLEKPNSDTSPIGFRTDLFFGDDAEQIHSTGLGGGVPTGDVPDHFDLQQAYVTYRAPIGSGLDLKMGKFVTLLGAEVIESPANWNYSRSYLFGFAIPFTHTGALASYPLGEWGSTTWGLVNGWDITDEGNSFKTILGNVTLTPFKGVTLSSNLITGAEVASNNRDDRTVLDFVGTWQPLEKLTLMANYDYGHQSNLAHGVTTGTKGPDAANWNGVALYAKYDLTDKWSLAGRWEWFNDADNVRTGFTGLGGSTLDDLRFNEYTLTSQWQLYTHLLARLEYRHDAANEAVFFSNNAGLTNSQDTIAAELIYHF